MRVLAALVVTAAVLGATPAAAAQDGWVWPVEGRVLTLYSNDNARPYAGGMHRGIDIAADVGRPVVAARAGTVTHAGVVGSSGLTVAVRTADGAYVTSYLHLSAVAVRKGDAVPAGARLGAAGTSGRPSAAEPHMHFGVRLAEAQDHYVDPLSLLPALPAPAAPPAPPAPAPVPVRAEPQPAPAAVLVPVTAVQRRPVPVPSRARPQGAARPGPVAVPAPVPRLRIERAPRPHPVPTGPGRALLFGGLSLIALVLFGGLAWRAAARANAGVNTGAAAVAAAIRDQIRIPPVLRRLLSP